MWQNRGIFIWILSPGPGLADNEPWPSTWTLPCRAGLQNLLDSKYNFEKRSISRFCMSRCLYRIITGFGFPNMIWRIWKCNQSWLMRRYYRCVIGLALEHWALGVLSSAHISNLSQNRTNDPLLLNQSCTIMTAIIQSQDSITFSLLTCRH